MAVGVGSPQLETGGRGAERNAVVSPVPMGRRVRSPAPGPRRVRGAVCDLRLPCTWVGWWVPGKELP